MYRPLFLPSDVNIYIRLFFSLTLSVEYFKANKTYLFAICIFSHNPQCAFLQSKTIKHLDTNRGQNCCYFPSNVTVLLSCCRSVVDSVLLACINSFDINDNYQNLPEMTITTVVSTS